MSRSFRSTVLSITALLAPLALTIACSRAPEQQMLAQFFRASKARDNATTSLMSAVTLDPRTQGTVESFSITSVSPEQRSPLDLKALMKAEADAKAAEAEFTKRKMEYQNDNLTIIEQVVKLERDPKAKMTKQQQAVKEAWDKWRTDGGPLTKAVAEAKAAVAAASGPAEASLNQPGQPAFDASAFEGELLKKEVTVDAEVRSPTGDSSKKTLTISLERVAGTLAGKQREGRWIIAKITGI